MRAVVQRVSSGTVTVDGDVIGRVQQGFVVLLGVAEGDTEADAVWIAGRLAGLRVFEDSDGRMNLGLKDVEGAGILLISQFTLLGDCRKGRRPAFTGAAEPGEANRLYMHCRDLLKADGIAVETGQFRATMQVSLVNEGPVTLLLDSRKQF